MSSLAPCPSCSTRVIWRGPGGCWACSGFLSQPRIPRLRKPQCFTMGCKYQVPNLLKFCSEGKKVSILYWTTNKFLFCSRGRHSLDIPRLFTTQASSNRYPEQKLNSQDLQKQERPMENCLLILCVLNHTGYFFQIFLILCMCMLDISMLLDGGMSNLLISPCKSLIFAIYILKIYNFFSLFK